MSNLQPNCCLKFDFQKVDQHAGGKWLIHDTKRHKDNQLQSLKLPCRISSWVARCDIKASNSTVLNPIFWKKVQGQKHPRRWGIVEHQIPSNKVLFKTNTKGHKHPSIRLLSTETLTSAEANTLSNSKVIYEIRGVTDMNFLNLVFHVFHIFQYGPGGSLHVDGT